jgi:hypothetical protein
LLAGKIRLERFVKACCALSALQMEWISPVTVLPGVETEW